MTAKTDIVEKPGLGIFRGKNAVPDSDAGLMIYEEFSPVAAQGLARAIESGFDNGHDLKVLFSAPGFSLIRLWFKSGFPLPRHVHDVDCLYYILGGSLQLGSEKLVAGDGFFVGSGVPYSYKPGPQGVDLLEFRNADSFKFLNLANTAAFWDQATVALKTLQEAWLQEQRPRD